MQQSTRWARALRGRAACLRALATARHDSQTRIGGTDVSRVLVVCYGNIYRSAFVEAFFARNPVPGVEFRSVGLHPVAGRESPPRHVAISRAQGADLISHRSRVLAPCDLEWAHLIVLMDRHNWQALVERGADRNRLVWLGTFDGDAVEIPDPYELDDEQAQRIVARLAECCRMLAATLVRNQARTRPE